MSGGGMSGGGMSGGGMSHTQHHSPSLLQYTVEARPIPSPPPYTGPCVFPIRPVILKDLIVI